MLYLYLVPAAGIHAAIPPVPIVAEELKGGRRIEPEETTAYEPLDDRTIQELWPTPKAPLGPIAVRAVKVAAPSARAAGLSPGLAAALIAAFDEDLI